MAGLSAEQIAQRAFDLNLLDERQLQEVWGQFGRRNIPGDEFLQALLRREWMTNYQAERLLKGERTASFESLRFLRVGLAFSPDGEYLAFSSKVGEQDAIYVMRVRDEDIVESLRFGMEGIETPSWSPDGRRLVFTGLEGGVSDLYVIDRDGRNLERLTDDRFAQRDPVWSPDGSRIAFTTDFGADTDFDLLSYDDYQIGIYEVATGEITYLPDHDGKNIKPQRRQ